MANLSSNENQPAAAQGLQQCNADTSLNVTSFKKSSECYGQLPAFLLLLPLQQRAETLFFYSLPLTASQWDPTLSSSLKSPPTPGSGK